MKKGLNKFAKGMFAIFTIKLLLFGGVFIIQSCQTEEIINDNKTEQKLAFSKFENLVQEKTPLITILLEKQKKQLKSKNVDVHSLKEQNDKEIAIILKPLIDGSKELLSYFDYSESDLSEDFEDSNDPRISLMGLMLLSASNQNKQTTTTASTLQLTSLLGNSLYAANSSYGGVRDCFLESTGIAAGVALVGALAAEVVDKGLVKKLIKKAVKKIGGRVLGGIGLAIIAIDFAYCMATDK
tara:strand:+ start:92 stop:811 length:720 start_codon:yes stop_codon:yes gene_type:complete